jgi:hypothetical protein
MTGERRTGLLASMASLASMAAALGLLGCDGAQNARGLDRICAARLRDGPACAVTGLGSSISAFTSDTRGFRLEDGELAIHLAAIPELRAPGSLDVEMLALSSEPQTLLDVAMTWGSCADDCPESPPLASAALPTEYAWTRVASGLRGPASSVAVPYDAVLTFTGVKIAIADLRLVPAP